MWPGSSESQESFDYQEVSDTAAFCAKLFISWFYITDLSNSWSNIELLLNIGC